MIQIVSSLIMNLFFSPNEQFSCTSLIPQRVICFFLYYSQWRLHFVCFIKWASSSLIIVLVWHVFFEQLKRNPLESNHKATREASNFTRIDFIKLLSPWNLSVHLFSADRDKMVLFYNYITSSIHPAKSRPPWHWQRKAIKINSASRTTTNQPTSETIAHNKL